MVSIHEANIDIRGACEALESRGECRLIEGDSDGERVRVRGYMHDYFEAVYPEDEIMVG